MTLDDPEAMWKFIKEISFDINKSAVNKISDFRNIIDILTSEYALTNERYSALFEIFARFKTSDVGALIQTDFDRYGSDLKFIENKIILIEEFESAFSFLFELRKKTIQTANGKTKAIEEGYDPDLIRAILGTKGSSVESLQKEKANIMSDWLRTIRKILDDAEMRLFPAQTSISDIAEKAGETGAQQQLMNFLKEQREQREKKQVKSKNV
ncbi:MAG: hypothetical protein DRP02_13860 [Candidatus Gerdarchaeota archaeon]|nr:MAG: hypothetical protein DRP02_13860 [Candidatus Gerdarchaeota archaeon]